MTGSEHVNESDMQKSQLGFWIYLMTDCVLFASLFATFAVLRNATAGGPGGAELFDLNYVLLETILLLTSSLTSGLALVALHEKSKPAVLLLLGLTAVLGLGFLGMELYEFRHLVSEGHSWQASAFLSSYFTLVGTHGLHILVGLIWLAFIVILLLKRGYTDSFAKRLTLFVLFWHFLDLIWIFIFSIVYLGSSF